MPRNTFSETLATHSQADLIERHFVDPSERRFEYGLNELDLDLYVVILALLRFGDDHLQEDNGAPLTPVHLACGHACKTGIICSVCQEPTKAPRVLQRRTRRRV